jgi:hypothetical protein
VGALVYNDGASKIFPPGGGMTDRNERVSPLHLTDMGAEPMRLSEKSGFETRAYLLKMARLEFVQREHPAAEDPNDAA